MTVICLECKRQFHSKSKKSEHVYKVHATHINIDRGKGWPALRLARGSDGLFTCPLVYCGPSGQKDDRDIQRHWRKDHAESPSDVDWDIFINNCLNVAGTLELRSVSVHILNPVPQMSFISVK